MTQDQVAGLNSSAEFGSQHLVSNLLDKDLPLLTGI
jgi:hypothetical protein